MPIAHIPLQWERKSASLLPSQMNVMAARLLIWCPILSSCICHHRTTHFPSFSVPRQTIHHAKTIENQSLLSIVTACWHNIGQTKTKRGIHLIWLVYNYSFSNTIPRVRFFPGSGSRLAVFKSKQALYHLWRRIYWGNKHLQFANRDCIGLLWILLCWQAQMIPPRQNYTALQACSVRHYTASHL